VAAPWTTSSTCCYSTPGGGIDRATAPAAHPAGGPAAHILVATGAGLVGARPESAAPAASAPLAATSGSAAPSPTSAAAYEPVLLDPAGPQRQPLAGGGQHADQAIAQTARRRFRSPPVRRGLARLPVQPLPERPAICPAAAGRRSLSPPGAAGRGEARGTAPRTAPVDATRRCLNSPGP